MPRRQNPHSHHNRRKLQPPKKPLMRAQIAKNPLARLRQPKYRPQINQQTRPSQRRKKRIFRPHRRRPLGTSRQGVAECGEEDEEDGEGEGLEGETAEEDVVRHLWGFPIRLRFPNTRRARNLHNGRHHIRRHKRPQHNPRPKPPPPFPPPAHLPALRPHNQPTQTNIDTRTNEHRRRHDHKILHDEIDNVVGVAAGGEGAEGVADCFENAGEGEGEEVVGFVFEEGAGVEDGGEGEEGDGEDAEGEGGDVAVDYYWGVVGAVGGWEEGEDVSASSVGRGHDCLGSWELVFLGVVGLLNCARKGGNDVIGSTLNLVDGALMLCPDGFRWTVLLSLLPWAAY